MNIETVLMQRYPGDGRCQKIRDKIANACNAFVASGLADANFTKELCSGSEQRFWSRLSEALLATHLREMGLDLSPSKNGGPDFLLLENGNKIWIEVICPEPTGVPTDWLTSKPNKEFKVITFPHEQILLRWTSAIKEKAEKLLGRPDGTKGYIEKGIVASGDAYVIAVNGCRLSNYTVSALFGISQFPFAVEAVFAIGPYKITINRETMETIDTGHQHRPMISKHSGAPVPSYTFLDPRFKPISAIWAADVKGQSAIGYPEPMAVIHNPNADIRIPTGFLPAHDEYVAKPIGKEMFEVSRIEGCLKSRY